MGQRRAGLHDRIQNRKREIFRVRPQRRSTVAVPTDRVAREFFQPWPDFKFKFMSYVKLHLALYAGAILLPKPFKRSPDGLRSPPGRRNAKLARKDIFFDILNGLIR